jgi:hypothetical protein
VSRSVAPWKDTASTAAVCATWSPSGTVLYPHGVAGLGVLIGDDDARTLADRIGGP